MSSILPADELVLDIAGRRWRGWTEASATIGIEQASGSFSLSLTDENGATVASLLPNFQPGAACSLAVQSRTGERATVITGYIDSVSPSLEAGSHRVAVAGRDAAGDLVDCSAVHAPSGAWSEATITTIASDLCAPFGVPVTVATDVGPAFSTWKIQDGETVWACIERACRQRALLCISDGIGGLVLTRSDAAPVRGVTLARGADVAPGARIRAAEASFSWQQRFSPVILKGQAPLHDDTSDAMASASGARAEDPAITRHRPQILQAEDLADGQTPATRAAWEVNVRAARSRRVEITVAGWRDSLGALWRPMTLARVSDAALGLDEDLLVTAVSYVKGASGSTARLTLLPAEAFAQAGGAAR